MYVKVGPTVYNYTILEMHVVSVSFSTIRRYFEQRGYDVNFSF